MANFDIAPMSSSIIMVVGVGGGGSNAVNHMYKLGITDVSFMVCNTDRQALERSPIPTKIRLGDSLTGGLGAGNKPERGRQAAMESIEDVRQVLEENNIKMVFVTAGMGGGTGTGAAPVIAKVAKEMGILTVAIVTIPFKTEGRKRIEQAIAGIEEIGHCVDSLLVIDNENIHEIYGELTLSEAFDRADDILATAAKSIAEIITTHYKVNVDFEDVRTVMQDSGVALMGSAIGSGTNRALEVAELAMSSPLLNHKDISGAQNVLLNITSGEREVTLSETYQITEYIQERAGNNNSTDLIWGAGQDESLGDNIRVTVIATGFGFESIPALKQKYSSTLQHRSPFEASNVGHGKGSANKRDVVLLDEPEAAKPSKATERELNSVDDMSVVTRDSAVTEFINTQSTYQRTAPVAEFISSRNKKTAEEAPQQPAEREEVAETYSKEILEQTTEKEVVFLTEDEMEIPAWLRRGRKIDNQPREGVKITHETLSGEPTKNKDTVATPDLFD